MPEIILFHIAWFVIAMFIFIASSFALMHRNSKRMVLFETLRFIGDFQMLAVAVSLAITFVLHNFDPLICIGLSNLSAFFIHRIFTA